MISDVRQMSGSLTGLPTDVGIARGALPGGRSNQMHGQFSSVPILYQIKQMCAHRSVAAQIMVLLQQTQGALTLLAFVGTDLPL
jgi:hypothetical protein